MAQQYASGQSGYLGLVAKAANTLVEGENRSKGKKKENDLVTQIEGEAVQAIGAKLLSGNATSSSRPKGVGELFNNLSSWHQGRGNNGARSYGGSREDNSFGDRAMSSYDGYGNQGNYGEYGYKQARAGNYGGDSGWNAPPSTDRSYGSQGYGGDARWSSGGANGNNAWDRPGDNLGPGRQGYYNNNNYEGYGTNDGYYNNNYDGYGNRSRMNDGYDRWNNNPQVPRGGYGY